MREAIENYLIQLNKEVREKISKDFNLNQDRFNEYLPFDYVNFHLIQNYILQDSKEKNDLFISIPEVEYRDNFFSSIFHSLVLIKLFQNYFTYNKTKPELEKGDIVYPHNWKKRVLDILNVGESNIKVKYKFNTKQDGENDGFTIENLSLTKLNPKLSKSSSSNIDSYSKFLNENFGNKFPFITDFKHKTLVVAEQRFFREGSSLPIRYTNRNGNIQNSLPFYNYLIECCNDYNTAHNFLLDTNFDEIIVIGDSKYRDSFDLILQEMKWSSKVKNIILIGTDRPNTKNPFIQWSWSSDEVKIANDEVPSIPENIVLENEALLIKLNELKCLIDKIKLDKEVNLSFLLKYTNFYIKSILTDSNLSNGLLNEYSDRLNFYFNSKEFEVEFNDQFYNTNIYDPNIINEYKESLIQLFCDLKNLIQVENLKWNYIKIQAKETRTLFIIVEKKSFSIIQNQINREKITNIVLIKEGEELNQWIKSTKNTETKKVIVPYINNIDQYTTLKSIKGSCEILCYANIDEILFNKISIEFNNLEKSKLTHTERQQFVSTKFDFKIEDSKNDLDEIFNFKNPNGLNYRIDLPRENVLYKIEFTDNTLEEFENSKTVFLVENTEQIPVYIEEVLVGSTIRFYQNNNSKLFNKVIRSVDDEKIIEEIDKYSYSWVETVKKIIQIEGSIELAYKNIFENNSKKIQLSTFTQYPRNERRFPQRMETLYAIRDYCINNNLSDELLVSHIEHFKTYSSKDSSIRNKAGRVLSKDLMAYIGTNSKSAVLKRFNDLDLLSLKNSIQEKTIKTKSIITDE